MRVYYHYYYSQNVIAGIGDMALTRTVEHLRVSDSLTVKWQWKVNVSASFH